jgi:hypothetical protein
VINLAGHPSCDRYTRRELELARIEIVEGQPAKGEVETRLSGRLGAFTFRRAWYYWVVKGPVPIAIAREIYADPVGKEDIRAGGHCGRLPPDEYGVQYFDVDGRQLYVDAAGSERRTIAGLIKRGTMKLGDFSDTCFVDSEAERDRLAARVIVDCYHIDSEIGLRVFADAVRGLE